MSKDSAARQRAAEKRKKRELEMRRKKTELRRHQTEIEQSGAKGVSLKDLPIAECVISQGWEERGLAHILLARRLPDGFLLVGGFYVDTFCLGIKDCAVIERIEEKEYINTIKPTIFNDPVELVDCPPELARAVAEGAFTFAEKFGFKPAKRWPEVRKIFSGVELPETLPVFGKDGKPCYIKRDETNSVAIIAKLERNAGAGNYLLLEGVEWK